MVYGGKKYKGTHMKAINTGKFLQVQKVMKNRGKPTKNKEKKNFPFTGLIKCAECGCSITAEEHKGHVYYRCTKKKGTCNQKYVRTEIIEKQVEEILSQIAVDDEIFKLMILALKSTQDNDYDVHKNSIDFWRKEYDRLEAKKKRLLDLITDAKISDSEFEEKRNEIDCEQSNVEDNLTEIKKAGNQWIELQKNLAINCYNAFLVFSKGDDTDKKLILHNVGSNFLLSGGNISWDWIEPFDVMATNTSRSNWRRGPPPSFGCAGLLLVLARFARKLGEDRIRTCDTGEGIPAFQASAIGHSATSPYQNSHAIRQEHRTSHIKRLHYTMTLLPKTCITH